MTVFHRCYIYARVEMFNKMTHSEIGKLVIFTCLCLIIKAWSIPTQANNGDFKTYRCKSGLYIFNKLACDGRTEHCGDPSDDFEGCDKKRCGAGKFKCTADNTCLNITARCNTIDDCVNGTDEINCGDETKVNDCHFHRGKFLCYDKLKCLDLQYTCDGFCNCFDCSDENSNCTKTENVGNEKCPLSHFPTPNGAQCFCDPSNKELNELCEDVEDCSSEHFCSQRCLKYKSKITCSCYENYHEVPGSNGVKCYSNVSLADVLLYTTSSKIKSLNMASSKISVLINEVESASLTAAHNYMYFTTYGDDKRVIHASSIGSRVSAPLIAWNTTITSIAVDYITFNVYFTASESLQVCSNDSRICRQLKCCHVDYIALAPKSGLMFYTRKRSRDDRRFIIKSGMDGSNEAILVDSSFNNPTALTVDEFAEKLYWINRNEHLILFSASFSGHIIARTEAFGGYGNETSVSVFQKKVFFAERRKNQVSKITWEITRPFKFYQDIHTSSVELLFAYNPLLQNIYQVKNPCNVTSCSTGLCLLRPAYLSTTTLDFTCV